LRRLWKRCLDDLEHELDTEHISKWLRPLQAHGGNGVLRLLAPNRYVLEHIRREYLARIEDLAGRLQPGTRVQLEVGAAPHQDPETEAALLPPTDGVPSGTHGNGLSRARRDANGLNAELVFDAFIEGKSNRLARAAAMLVAQRCGAEYNPLLIYGGVGLGKTHLLHAIGNAVRRNEPHRRIVYTPAERFVNDMVGALATRGRDGGQFSNFERFRAIYRDTDLLLVDDIQFLAGKERSQEEFFHIFNALLDGKSQVVMTCDRYPRDIHGLGDRLKSRFGWGLTVAVEPPDLETRVAIVLSKSALAGTRVPEDVAFLIGRRIHSNVRELEGALRLVLAYANFTEAPVTVELAREALKDVLRAQDRLVTVDAIQRAVAEHFGLRTADLVSPSRRRSVTRPRQLAMALAKELTNASLPEIGAAFGGRDHTTVLHACARTADLRAGDAKLDEAYRVLLRTLTV
jgi:chromosomal replication initiator protein